MAEEFSTGALLDEVRAVYAALDKRPIERACVRRTECCQFQLTGMLPHLTVGEALVAATALRRGGRTKLPKRDDGACPLLARNGSCLVYDSRPFGCRTHFCRLAGGPLGRGEVLDLIRSLEAADEKLGGDGARPLPVAIGHALRLLG